MTEFRAATRASLLLLVPLLITSLAVILHRPVAFQKIVSIIETQNTPQLNNKGTALDADHFVRGIPYLLNGKILYDVLPRDKYRSTILEGDGNCSNLVFGAAYALLEKNIDFQIIHIMHPVDFYIGYGHTVLWTYVRHGGMEQPAVVDLAYAGLHKNGNRLLTISDLQQGSIANPGFVSLNHGRTINTAAYEWHLKGSVIGVIPGNQVKRYFEFLESVYFDLGNERLNKYVFDGLALLAGRYPKIYVESKEALQLSVAQWFLFRFILWFLRIAPLWLAIVLIAEAYGSRRHG